MSRGRLAVALALAAVVLLALLVPVNAVDAETERRRRHHARAHAHHKRRRASEGEEAAVADGDDASAVFGAVFASGHGKKKTWTFNRSEGRPIGGRKSGAVAWGVYEDRVSEIGWEKLSVKTSGKFGDVEQAYAAGYLEGALSFERIYLLWRVIDASHPNADHRMKVKKYFEKQDKFLRNQVHAAARAAKRQDDNDDGFENSADPADGYWYNVGLVLAQFDGLLDGYNAYCQEVLNNGNGNGDGNAVSGDEQQHPRCALLTREDNWLIQSDGDMMDIERAVTSKHKKVAEMNEAELIELVTLHGRCSAMIKWTGDDLLSAHTTWDDFVELLRSYKHYDFDFTHPSVQAGGTSHSSYPGFISSSDDFYILSSGLVAIETTLNILDDNLYADCDPSSQVVAWIRNLVANRMATDGKSWCDIFGRYNSGTYNDQWMIVDYNKFRPGLQRLNPGTLWVMEQVPGKVEKKDMSSTLSMESYWASFNRPYFDGMKDIAFYSHYEAKHRGRDTAEMLSYETCPRGRIFKRDYSSVSDVAGMQAIMMSNDWENDPFSKGCPGNAIASRFDIVGSDECNMGQVANGATDSKVTNSAMVRKRQSRAIAGPTHEKQPAFSWNDARWSSLNHAGQPDTWAFDWVDMMPHA